MAVSSERCEGEKACVSGYVSAKCIYVTSDIDITWNTHTCVAKTSKPSRKSKKKEHAHHSSTNFDHAHLAFGHHQAIVASLALLPCLQEHFVGSSSSPSGRPEQSGEEKGGPFESDFGQTEDDGHQLNLLLIGLGGGALPMFVNKYIPNVSCLFFVHVIVDARATG